MVTPLWDAKSFHFALRRARGDHATAQDWLCEAAALWWERNEQGTPEQRERFLRQCVHYRALHHWRDVEREHRTYREYVTAFCDREAVGSTTIFVPQGDADVLCRRGKRRGPTLHGEAYREEVRRKQRERRRRKVSSR